MSDIDIKPTLDLNIFNDISNDNTPTITKNDFFVIQSPKKNIKVTIQNINKRKRDSDQD